MLHLPKVTGISLVLGLLVLVANQASVDAWWFWNGNPETAAAASAAIGLKAIASFDLDGVKGSFKFTQTSSDQPTVCDYELTGLNGNNKFYHVHIRPVPAFDAEKVKNNATAIAQLCGDPATGGHLNPHHITAKLPPQSAPFDQYETGDLSGKHGPLARMGDDLYKGQFVDNKISLFAPESIIGRSIVIHKNDGKRWVCASIQPLQ